MCLFYFVWKEVMLNLNIMSMNCHWVGRIKKSAKNRLCMLNPHERRANLQSDSSTSINFARPRLKAWSQAHYPLCASNEKNADRWLVFSHAEQKPVLDWEAWPSVIFKWHFLQLQFISHHSNLPKLLMSLCDEFMWNAREKYRKIKGSQM